MGFRPDGSPLVMYGPPPFCKRRMRLPEWSAHIRPLKAFDGHRFRERRDRPLCHLMVRQQIWLELEKPDQSPAAVVLWIWQSLEVVPRLSSDRRHLHAISAGWSNSGGR